MSEPFMGEIRMFGGYFAPRGWALCWGQLMGIAQNSALFSILGTTYGGDGQTTFALPDFRGRVPVGMGQGHGLPAMNQGQIGGEVNHTLITAEMPVHTHTVQIPASAEDGLVKNPSGNVMGATANPIYAPSSAADATMAAPTVGVAGGSLPHNVMQPYLVMNFIIAVQGTYPSRN